MECGVSKTLQLKTFYSTKNNFLKLNNIDLSEEIVLLILSYLSMKDIVNLSILNRSFKRYWTCHPLIWNNFSLKFGFYCKNISTVQDVIDYVFKPNYLLKQSFTKAISRNVTDTFKVVLCGDEKTGKSTWLKRFLHNFYDENYRKTVGMEYFSHSLQYVESNFYAYSLRDIRVQLDLWDLGGHAKYFALFPLVTRESRGVMLCFDLSNEMSFDSIETLLNDYVKRHLHNIDGNSLNEKIKNAKKVICVIGLKSDCITKRNKSLDEKVNNFLMKLLDDGNVIFKDLFVQYFEVSSKDNLNVEIPFYFMAYKYLKMEREVMIKEKLK